MLVQHFVRFCVIILAIFIVIRPMLLCAEIDNFPFPEAIEHHDFIIFLC